jgi:BON domain
MRCLRPSLRLKAAVVPLALCGLFLVKAGAGAANPDPPKERPKLEKRSNLPPDGQQLSRQVRHQLRMLADYSVFDNIEYRMHGDRVELLGQVVQPWLKSEAEAAVKRVEGVRSVTNHIEVLPLSPNDDRLRLECYRAIFLSGGLQKYAMEPVPGIHIIVKNGNITLVGVVDSESDKNFANLRARGVPGAFSVANELAVENGT